MMNPLLKTCAGLALFSLPLTGTAATLDVTVSNRLDLARTSETIELSAADLSPLQAENLNRIHIKDAAGVEILCQAIDLDGDPLRTFDAVIFQADFAVGESKSFSVSVGAKQVYKKEQYKAFGRFVRERFDDFTWENDLIAHRTYGAALETWQGEPLASSTIDVWSKRTPRMVINDWYLADDYHVDHGDGADFYSAGVSRGCGGIGLWADEKLWVSRNFTGSKVLANGPIRVLFELEYPPFSVGNASVAETKRVSLDAGQQFDHFESRFKPYMLPGKTVALTAAIGLKKVAGESVEEDPAKGWLLKWEKVEKNSGNQGLALITAPAAFERHVVDSLDHLLLVKTDARHVVRYWAGFCWDKAGAIPNAAAWKQHVTAFARGLDSPLEVKISPVP